MLGAAEKYKETHDLWWVTYKMAEGVEWVKPGVDKEEEPKPPVDVTLTMAVVADVTALTVKNAAGETITANPANTYAAKAGEELTVELTVTGTPKYVVAVNNGTVTEIPSAEGKYIYTITAADKAAYTFRTTDGELELFWDGDYTATNWFDSSAIAQGTAIIDITSNATAAGLTIQDVLDQIVTGLGVKPEVVAVYDVDHVEIPQSNWTRYVLNSSNESVVGSIVVTVGGQTVTILEANEPTASNFIVIKDEAGNTIKTGMKGEKISLDVPAGFYAIDGESKHYEVKEGALAEIASQGEWTAAPVAAGTLTFTLGNDAESELTLKAGYWELTVNEEEAVKVKAGGAPESGLTGLAATNGAWYFIAETPAQGAIDTTKVQFNALAKETGAETLMVPDFEMPAANTTVGTGYFKVVKITVADETTTETLYLAKDAEIAVAANTTAIVDDGETITTVEGSDSAKVTVTGDVTVTLAPADRVLEITVDGDEICILSPEAGKMDWAALLEDVDAETYVTITTGSNDTLKYYEIKDGALAEVDGSARATAEPVYIKVSDLNKLEAQTHVEDMTVTTGFVKLTIDATGLEKNADVKYTVTPVGGSAGAEVAIVAGELNEVVVKAGSGVTITAGAFDRVLVNGEMEIQGTVTFAARVRSNTTWVLVSVVEAAE